MPKVLISILILFYFLPIRSETLIPGIFDPTGFLEEENMTTLTTKIT